MLILSNQTPHVFVTSLNSRVSIPASTPLFIPTSLAKKQHNSPELRKKCLWLSVSPLQHRVSHNYITGTHRPFSNSNTIHHFPSLVLLPLCQPHPYLISASTKICRQITESGFPNPNFTSVEEPAFFSIRRRFKVHTESAILELRHFVSLTGFTGPVALFGRFFLSCLREERLTKKDLLTQARFLILFYSCFISSSFYSLRQCGFEFWFFRMRIVVTHFWFLLRSLLRMDCWKNTSFPNQCESFSFYL